MFATAVLRSVRRAGWAPLAVLVFHAAVAHTRYRVPLDFTMHFSGGAAIAYFLFEALGEFAELASDVFLQTHIQLSLLETMHDLIADNAGAAAGLLVLRLLRR